MTWIKPEFSKSAVNKAGKLISYLDVNDKKYDETINIVNNWRASHAYPLNKIRSLLKYHAKKIDNHALIIQRLKRISSVLSKLERYPKMQLSRMQDLGGCRAVLTNIKQVYDLKEAMECSKTRNILHSTKDYIEEPKLSGYRGVHLIYKFQSRNSNQTEYNGLLVEIQIRTKIQHSWATAVEIVDTFTKQSLKIGQGSRDWEEFFELIGYFFSRLEQYENNENFSLRQTTKESDYRSKVDRARNLAKDLNVEERLITYSVVANVLGAETEELGYYLLTLNIRKESISLAFYEEGGLPQATKDYGIAEKKYKNDDNIIVTLVAVESIKDLKSGYPNYFGDSNFFLENLKKVID